MVVGSSETGADVPAGVSDFDHVLVTRVAVRLDERRPLPDEGWLRMRHELFLRYCLPSVAAQDVQDFRWLLFVDQGAPAWLTDDLIERLRPGWELVRISEPCTPDVVTREVGRRVSRPWLISTRLDSDDAISRDYLRTVRAQFEGQDFEFVNVLNGAQLSQRGVFAFAHPSNAFISLIERRSDAPLRTVFLGWHDRVRQHGPVRQVEGPRRWLQVLHGDNLANGESGFRVQPSSVLPRFEIDLDLQDERRARLLMGQAKSILSMGRRLAGRPARAVLLLGLVKEKLKCRRTWFR